MPVKNAYVHLAPQWYASKLSTPPSSIIKSNKHCFKAILNKAFCTPLIKRPKYCCVKIEHQNQPPPSSIIKSPEYCNPNSKSQKTSFFQAFLLRDF